MVTKRKTSRAAPRRRYAPRATARRAAPRRKSGTTYIPAAAATVALVAANAKNIKEDLNFIQTHNLLKPSSFSSHGKEYALNFWKKYVSADQLVKDGIAYGAGYLGGEIVKKYAPSVIKTPLGKLAKKIPRM